MLELKVIFIPGLILSVLSLFVLNATNWNIQYDVLSMISLLFIIIYILICFYFILPQILLIFRFYKPRSITFNERTFKYGTMYILFGFFVLLNFSTLIKLDFLSFIGFKDVPFVLQSIILGIFLIIAIVLIYPFYYWNLLLFYTTERKNKYRHITTIDVKTDEKDSKSIISFIKLGSSPILQDDSIDSFFTGLTTEILLNSSLVTIIFLFIYSILNIRKICG